MELKRRNPHVPRPPIGWPLLPLPDATGSLSWPDLETSVRQTIRAILVTRPGERLLDRQFGGGLQDFIHQPNTVLTRKRIHDKIREAVARWEPRVALHSVSVEPEGEFEERIRITIAYRLRTTGASGAMSIAVRLGG